MIREMWGQFPRLLEQNLNGLLDQAFPNPTKAFQLYKSCKMEDLWSENFAKFSEKLEHYFARPRQLRKKSDFDRFLDRPMDSEVFKSFHLNFRTAVVSEESLANVASWAHNLMRVSLKTSTIAISLDVMTKTLQNLTNPAPFEKDINLEFEDFCVSWKRTLNKLFGNQHDQEMRGILRELRALKAQLELDEAKPIAVVSPTIYLTQTELDWVNQVKVSAEQRLQAPKFPLSRGATKPLLVDLERVVQLYEIVRVTQLPELLKHRESTRATILARCEELIPISSNKLAA